MILADSFASLQGFWFVVLAVLWGGYFVLEGFDFGVGMLMRLIGRDEAERKAVIGTIEPVWDGNEVWLIVAGGATFAAFPSWYATLFSGYYIVFFLILLGLIFRGVAIEYRAKRREPRWCSAWEVVIVLGSVVPAFLWGVVFANVIHGVPIDGNGEFSGGLLDLFGGYAILGGFVSLALFAFHGAVFLTLRTEGEVRRRAKCFAIRLAVPAIVLALAIFAWSGVDSGGADGKWIAAALLIALAGALLLLSLGLVFRDHDGAAFAATALAIVSATAMLFVSLYPRVLVSSTSSANNLTIFSTSSSHHTLVVMTIVALVFTPIVLVYQGWTYWVFRARLRGDSIPGGGVSSEAADRPTS
ncbi:MAG: cytochrome d ubiquinol oxidase subunit II [Gaiellaceae bacterium]|jgi:cytochrome d ubiquinol oxidase subunit II